MKRKIIRRNKQFLSSRFGKYLSGHGTFQRHICHSVYFTSDDEMIFKRSRYKWQWFFNEDWLSNILSSMELDGTLEEISALDQELGSYDNN